MAKWVLNRPGTWDYPDLGFTATNGAILDATSAPDTFWSLNGDQNAAETVVRRGTPALGGGFVTEPPANATLLWNADQNRYDPTTVDVREAAALVDYAKLLPWFANLANRRASPVDVLMIGDSIVEGYKLSAFADTLPSQLASALRGRLGVTTAGRGFIGPQTDMTNHAFWPLVASGGASFVLGYGPNDRIVQFGGAGQKVVLTLSSSVTAFDLVFFKSSTGSATGGYYKIDAGANVTFSVNNATTIVTTLRVNAAANTTIEVGWNAGAAWSFCGIVEYKGDENAGIRVHNCAVSGTTAANWNTYAVTGWATAQALLAPDLVIINLGTNDSLTAVGNVSSATFKANLNTMIATIRAAMPNPPIVLNAAYNAQNGASAVEPWVNYVARMREIADASSSILVVDHSSRMYATTVSDTAGLYNAGGLPHASAKGYALMAETLATALAPR